MLNTAWLYTGPQRPGWETARSLRRHLLRMHEKFIVGEGSGVDYARLRVSPEFAAYVQASAELQVIDPATIPLEARIATFLNLYNVMVIHGYAVYGVPDTHYARMAFYGTVAYRVGPWRVSLNDVEHGLLRGNKRPPYTCSRLLDADEPRARWAIPADGVDPRIHFALNCGARSCPAIRLYCPRTLQRALDRATEHFFRTPGNAVVDEASRTLSLSKILHWYIDDFGGNLRAVVEWVLPYLPAPTATALCRILQIDYTPHPDLYSEDSRPEDAWPVPGPLPPGSRPAGTDHTAGAAASGGGGGATSGTSGGGSGGAGGCTTPGATHPPGAGGVSAFPPLTGPRSPLCRVSDAAMRRLTVKWTEYDWTVNGVA